MGLLNIFGKKDSIDDIGKRVPFSISTELVPYKLYAKRKSSASLRVKVANLTNDVLLTSVVAETPGRIGFDEIGMSKQREIRIGEMQPKERKEIVFEVFSGNGSESGEYTIGLTAIAHYRDYGHVLNAVKRRISIGVV